MSVLHIFLFLSLLYHPVILASVTSIRVSTQQGDVLGKEESVLLHNGQTKTVYKFLGIPYAQMPTGCLRFKVPLPLTNKRQNDYDATYYRPICFQILDNKVYLDSTKLAWPGFNVSENMSEDCLFLNIYTPSTNCTIKYPVIVHIHGGSYVAGTPIRDISPGEYLPTQGVVLVTIQYRLGAFGFFSTGDSEAPGNLGLLDQIEALKWIRDNINGFCGNKDSVTLLGESAGGSSVSLHYLSPLSKDLFHRGIAVSGVAFTPFASKPKASVLKASKTLIKGLGCERQNSQLTLHCLRSSSRSDIIKKNTDLYNIQPFVDNYFLLDEPRKLLEKGEFHKLPLMSGFVSNEGTNRVTKANINNITDYRNYMDKELFIPVLNFSKQEAPIAFDALASQYTPWDDLENSEAYEKSYIDMFSDYMVIAPTHDVLSFHSHHRSTTYMFEFAHRSRQLTRESWKGVTHEDTTAYKFGLPLLKSPKTNLRFDDDDRAVSKKMVTLFTNFAKSGNPNSPCPVKGVKWDAFETCNKTFLKFQKTLAITSKYYPIRMAFLNHYFQKLFPRTKSKSWYDQCKKSETARPVQSPKDDSNPAIFVRGAPNPEIVLW